MKCPLLGGASKRLQAGSRYGAIAERHSGAGDEDPGSDFESDGKEDYVVAGGRDAACRLAGGIARIHV